MLRAFHRETSMSAFLIMTASLVVGLFLVAAALTFVARSMRYPKPGFRRSLLVVGAWIGMNLVAFYLTMTISDPPETPFKSLLSAVLCLVLLLLEVAMVRFIQRPSLLKALGGWALLMIVRLGFVVIMLLCVRGPLVEAFRAPTLSMAPTLLGDHAVTVCPRCGGPGLYSLDEDSLRLQRALGAQLRAVEGFCMQCRQSVSAPLASLTPVPADRFFATKFLTPKRWVLVVFKNRGLNLVKRLVAFPGETIAIDDQGKISLNGQPLTPPPGVPAQFRWLDTSGMPGPSMALKPNDPIHLGPDDYFVIGDFAERSSDSRIFGPIHKANIVGVVSLIYWPPTRVRIVR
jgi:signal peptidase I